MCGRDVISRLRHLVIMSSESRTQAAVDALFLLPTSFLAVTGSPSTDGNSHVSPIVSILSSRQHSSALDSSSSTTLDSSSDSSSTALDSPSSPAPSQSVDVDTSSFQGLGTETPKDKGMRQKGKRFNMPEHRRIELFRRERLVGEVFPHAVWCKECQAWVALDKRRRFYMGMWEKHLKTYHLPGGLQYEKIQRHLLETGEKLQLFRPKSKNTP